MSLADDLRALGANPEDITDFLTTRISAENTESAYLVFPLPNRNVVKLRLEEDPLLYKQLGVRTLIPTEIVT